MSAAAMVMVLTSLGWILAGVALFGAAYALAAAVLTRRFMRVRPRASSHCPAVSILKPLYRDEPGLSENLESFFAQDYGGPIQIVFGVHDDSDPAMGVARALKARHPDFDIEIVADGLLYGANAKVSNLINMLPKARHDILVLSDSDIRVPPSWLGQVIEALARPGVGLVTCLYTGAAALTAPGLWPTLSAMGTSYDFLPNVVLGTSLGLADPCMGSTIALTRATLNEIGGFPAFADHLADDYEIGRAVRDKGLALAIPALGVTHIASETSLKQLIRHELRWTRTIRMVNPKGHLGSVVTFGFPISLLAALLLGFNPPSLAAIGLTLAARLFLKRRIDGIFGGPAGPFWLLPLRDLLSFVVFVLSQFGEAVYWRDSRFSIAAGGALTQ